ncbi:amidohydrolase family protein [Sulfitobacter sp. G21635-S1]|uniref:amidohydrolase family protein n=1 Tax=Sulfitobacter sp. G21635-S1 TaxID=3014043 RepID=UPI0022B075BB|nr:amidohydrolase family protein [Sulfitobacter sp. G21635-S1]MCZ4254207.1 amidohydrolase family protein [Sulfitobacter sp. G21635-S1]
MARKLIRNAHIISIDPEVGVIPRGDILIEGSKIAAIGTDLSVSDAEIIDGEGRIAIPGFIDTHRHTWQALLRASGADWTLAQYFAGVRGVMGTLYTPDDMKIGNHLGAIAALDAGITTLYDWSHNNNSPDHSSAAVEGLMAAGMRAVFGYGNSDAEWVPVSDAPSDFEDVARVKREYFSSDDQLVTMGFAARGNQFATMRVTKEDFVKARDLGLRISVHMGDGLWGMNKPVVDLHAEGLTGPDVTYVHCNSLQSEDFQIIGDTGGTASIAPELELHMGHGFPPTLSLMKVGVRPSISIDVVTTVPDDMFSAMRALLSGTRAVVNNQALIDKVIVDPLPLMATDVLEFATLQGAIACGLGDKTGSLTVGKEADIVLVNCNSLNTMPMNNAYGIVVEAAHAGNVETVIVAGNIRKRDFKLVDFDHASFKTRVEAARDGLFEKAGVPSDGSWLPRPFEAATDSEF